MGEIEGSSVEEMTGTKELKLRGFGEWGGPKTSVVFERVGAVGSVSDDDGTATGTSSSSLVRVEWLKWCWSNFCAMSGREGVFDTEEEADTTFVIFSTELIFDACLNTG